MHKGFGGGIAGSDCFKGRLNPVRLIFSDQVSGLQGTASSPDVGGQHVSLQPRMTTCMAAFQNLDSELIGDGTAPVLNDYGVPCPAVCINIQLVDYCPP